MRLSRSRWIGVLALALMGSAAAAASAADGTNFRVGAADKNITPPPGIPMWGFV